METTLDLIASAIDLIERVIVTLWFHETLAGTVIATIVVGGTEFLKRGIRTHTKLTDDWTPRAVAVALGLLVSPVIWPDASNLNGWVMGLAISLGAFLAYPMVLRRMRRD